jgi:hypothetical protein
LRSREPRQKELAQQVEAARRSLSRLLKATGVVFNLSIGKIIRQDKEGLVIDLSTFYEAVKGRSEVEIDKALQHFFAKAVLGLLTRLNLGYIASGRGHQERFKRVVLKLQELVFKSREYDKFKLLHHTETAEVETLSQLYLFDTPTFSVHGNLAPSFEMAVNCVEAGEESQAFSIVEYRLQIEAGAREGINEARFYSGETLQDMVFLPKLSLENVCVHVAGHQIRWTSRS